MSPNDTSQEAGGSETSIRTVTTSNTTDEDIAERARKLKYQAFNEPEAVDLDEIFHILQLPGTAPSVHLDALSALRRVSRERPLGGRFVEPLSRLLTRPSMDGEYLILQCLAKLAETEPDAVLEHIGDVFGCIATKPTKETQLALKVCSTLVKEDSVAFVDAAPRIATHVGSDNPTCRRHAVYILQVLAVHSPEEVAPYVDRIVDTLADATANYRINALIAIGRSIPVLDSFDTPVDAVCRLIDAPEDMVRANALALLADITKEEPSVGLTCLEDMVGAFDDDDDIARNNASAAFLNVALEHPGQCRIWIDELRERLDDSNPGVRRNACEALGHCGTLDDYDNLQAKAVGDPNASVKRTASKAMQELLNN